MPEQREVQVAIIGSGFSGLGMAHALRRQGIDDFVVLERSSEVGGVWQANTYPGLTCDVPSHLYSFSFALNPDWSSTYSPQPEIQAYLRRCVDDLGLGPHIRTGVDVRRADWDGDRHQWVLETDQGRWTASILVSAAGALTEPRLPDVPGLADFRGTVAHTARWDRQNDLTGQRVAVVGTGSSAIQLVPQIADQVAQLSVFQRTPPWVVPQAKRRLTDVEHRLYRRLPAAQRAVRAGVYVSREVLAAGYTRRPELLAVMELASRRHMARQISDPALLAAVTPDYRLGCKRLLPSNRWYPTLGMPQVELVPSALQEVRARSVVGADGVERHVDTIVFATGYHVTDNPFAERLHGRDGRSLTDVWSGSPRAYLGSTVPGFPNLFLLLGPNTGQGHTSMVFMLESQLQHVTQVLATWQGTRSATVEVSQEAHDVFNAELDERMQRTVWTVGGCSSYYLDANGRNAANWPDFTWRFRRRAKDLDPEAYVFAGRRAVEPERAGAQASR